MKRSVWRPIGLLALFTGLAITACWPAIGHSWWSCLAVGALVFTGACVVALGGQSVRILEASDEQRYRALKIVEAYGRTSMAHLALLDDKDYFFSPGGSLIAFTVVGGTAVTLGDPIGPVQDAESAIIGFCRLCAQKGWLPAFGLASADYLDIYRRHHFRALCLGHEGILDLKKFTLKGNANKNFRKRYNRLSELGYQVKVIDPPIPDATLYQLRQVSDEWLKMVHAAEKRFFLALFDESYIRGERIAVVYNPQGSVSAFVNLVPEYQRNEVSIDLMRKRRHVESGTMDFFFVSLFLWARQQGYDTFNLGLSPLYGVGETLQKPWVERLIHFAYEHGRFYDFKGLNGFKIKFHPRWEPQYLIYPGVFNLLRVGLALAKVNAGAGESLWQYFKSHPKHTSPDDS